MEKTQNYYLNKPEVTDPLRLADFNENADKIDAALKNLNTAVGSKAEQSVVTAVESALSNKANAADLTALSQTVSALSTAVSGKGNCKIVHGSYTGTGTYMKANPNTLSFDFCPVLIMVASELDYVFMMRDMPKCQHKTTENSSAALELTWNNNGVSWYNSSSDYYQLNAKDSLYRYVAIGY